MNPSFASISSLAFVAGVLAFMGPAYAEEQAAPASKQRAPAKQTSPSPSAPSAPTPATSTPVSIDVLRRVKQSTARVVWRDRVRPAVVTRRNAIAIDADQYLLMAGPPPEVTAGAITVTHANGLSGRARVIAGDTEAALTLLRLPGHGLPAVALRNETSATLAHRGERVAMVNAAGAIARGALRSFGTRVTVRRGRFRSQSLGLLEAGLATVADDVGSPFADVNGRVIGLFLAHRVANTTSRERGATRTGVTLRPHVVSSYAIPASTIAVVWPLLRDRGRVPRAILGSHVKARPAPAELREHLCAGCPSFVITQAATIGLGNDDVLRSNDVIVSFNDLRLPEGASLDEALLPYRPGDSIRVRVLRGGKPTEVVVKLKERRQTAISIGGGGIQIRQQVRSKARSGAAASTESPDER